MWYLVAALPLLIEVVLIVHVLRTGRDRFWVLILFFLPLAGCLAYVLIEILPGLLRGRAAAQVRTSVTRALDPGRRVRQCEAALALSPSVENRSALAEAWEEAGEPAKAVDLYTECLSGIYRTDRTIMARLACALHAAGYHARARQLFTDIIRMHGALSSAREILFFAATLEACGETPKAEETYRAAAARSAGLEAHYRYVAFLKRTGRAPDAERELGTMLQGFSMMPRFARRVERRWVDAARRELAAT